MDENTGWFKKFVKICDENNIWYEVFFGTLIGTIREKGPIPWDDDFDVIMTPESYKKLKSLYPEHCLDNENNKKYPLMISKFVPDIQNFINSSVFVDIFLLVKSTKKNIKKYTSMKTKIWYSIQVFRSKWIPRNLFERICKYITFPFWFITPRLTITDAQAILKGEDIYYVINSPFAENKEAMFQNISLKIIKKYFLDFEVNVPKDYHKILTQEYSNYMIPIEYERKHVNTISTS